MRFSGQAAVVAGAGGGMGLNIGNDLIAAGVNVTLCDLKPKPTDIRDGPGQSAYFCGNLGEEDFVAQVIQETSSRWNRLDYLVNTVGVLWFGKDKSLVEMDLDIWDRVLVNNLKSFVLTSRFAIPEMQKNRGGALVHFSSVDALVGDSKPQDAYGASKAAIIRLSKSIAIQFASDGIRSNAILPGPVMSPMQDRWKDKPHLQADVAQSIPLGRIGTTQDLSNACLFLLSDEASFITGTELIVDGGVTAK